VQDTVDRLLARWDESFPSRLPLGQELIRRYGAVPRVYHDVRHLLAVLERVDELSAEADDDMLVRLAAWYHDAVYDVRRDDNEERSAALAEATLPVYDFDPNEIAEVARLVRLTRTHAPEPDDHNGAVLCDADLAVLAGDRDDYATYREAVRVEYRHVPDSDFTRGRAAVLQQLLDLDRLFHTETGHARWEQAARDNLKLELEELGQSIPGRPETDVQLPETWR
jgi:predicted metal-dependent HD superfamily phosphohydrolase